jgi:O-antigen/teichoic acid export membrane protein
MKNIFKKIISNQTLMFMVGGFLPAGLNLVTLPFIALYISPDEFGIYSYTNAFQSILIVFGGLSMNSYLLRLYFDKSEPEKLSMIGTIFILLIFMNFLITILLLVLMPIIVPKLNNSVSYFPYFFLMILTVSFEYIYMIPQVIFRIKRKALKFVFFGFSRMLLIQIVTLILIIKFDTGIIGRYIGNLSGNLVFAIISIPVIFRNSIMHFKIDIVKEAIKFSLPIIPAALIGILYTSIDKIILLKYFSLSELGLYAIASSISLLILIISQGYYKSVEPVIFNNFSNSFLY